MQLGARERLGSFLDPGTGQELATSVGPSDPLHFRDTMRYRDRLELAQESTGELEALIVMRGKVLGLELVACALEFDFIAGTMGSAVGERFVRAVDYCLDHRMPLVVFTASGGARLQEGMFSLMQMAKTSAALARMASAGLPYVSVLTHPTMGGVTASIGMLGDLEIAEPEAQVGFAGPRVIRQTTGETLPAGFQRAEFLLDHGATDMILDRRELRERIVSMLRLLLGGPRDGIASGHPAGV